MAETNRMQQCVTVTITKGMQTSGAFSVAEVATGVIQTPSAMTSKTSNFLVCTGKAETYVQVCNTSGAAVQCQLTVSKAIKIPDEVFIGGWRAKLQAFRTEAAARTIGVATKS